MALSNAELVELLDEKLRLSGKPVMTLTWAQLYDLAERDRFKQAALDELQVEALRQFQLVVGLGKAAVIIAHDRNFSAVK